MGATMDSLVSQGRSKTSAGDYCVYRGCIKVTILGSRSSVQVPSAVFGTDTQMDCAAYPSTSLLCKVAPAELRQTPATTDWCMSCFLTGS